jgi:hypothetical protein
MGNITYVGNSFEGSKNLNLKKNEQNTKVKKKIECQHHKTKTNIKSIVMTMTTIIKARTKQEYHHDHNHHRKSRNNSVNTIIATTAIARIGETTITPSQ